ncbi:unnamed protein product, partial [Scytosiphon promiscuus]
SFFQPVYLDKVPSKPFQMDEPAPLSSTALHGEYRQDKRALRGARASSAGGRDEGWQAEAEADLDNEDLDNGRGNAITLSSLPRGYWATLFNLEVVKARNRPKEPPKKPEAAPFFLSTVHQGGDVEPSFPEMGTVASAKTAPKAADDDGGDVPDLPSGGGDDAWSDDDDEDDEDQQREAGEGGAAAAHRDEGSAFGGGGPSRCKLADLLLACEETAGRADPMEDDSEEEEGGGSGREKCRFGGVMAYLKTLAPPSVDVEMSLLCQGDWDEDGIRLIGLAIDFLLEELRSKRSFEVVQAYLHRFLKHYSEIIMTSPEL